VRKSGREVTRKNLKTDERWELRDVTNWGAVASATQRAGFGCKPKRTSLG
jgi:hypothetical protein